ncbi:ATP-binding protein [Bacillus massilinigeriensis]|uniref:ATP-binding protein n=1 Tax=Bacillus mediterraneensis TaxID=1805474 RepID=UPI0008F88FE9|nr:ATP-binding protein [Bacillus mediterraneensis]
MQLLSGNINQDKIKRIGVAATSIALAAQVNMPFFVDGFILTLSVILLPVFLYFNDDLNPVPLTIGIAIASPFFRGLLLFITNNYSIPKIAQFVFTDIAFYLCYGCLYYFLYWHRTYRNDSSFFFTILLCDYISNILEISLLLNFSNYSLSLFKILFLVALVRTLISCFSVFMYHYFTLMIRKKGHEQRYYHFLWSVSAVKSEVYFMNKNINEIERIMKNAYLLNKELSTENPSSENGNIALNIARDVHEVKKDYQNVIKGLGSYFEVANSPSMRLSEILKIVLMNSRSFIREREFDILIAVKNQIDLQIHNHYYLVSILSNIISNSIDAIGTQHGGSITVIVEDQGKQLQISFSDNGPGIPLEIRDMIFQPGFSTKFNQYTGDIYRGIGLSHVKMIMEEQFGGNIKFISEEGRGTVFFLTFNKEKLTVEEQS